jgi:acyl phosphate:glycerol-3-phosphate acyltransferase
MPNMLWEMPAIALALGYIFGSIPFGLLLTRITGAGDLRSIGSGNIGATNVLRTGRKGLAAVTLLLDMLKGAAAVLIAEAIAPGTGAIAGVAAFVGHVFPIWLKFRGGKGVATMMGVVAALHWPAGLVYAAVWLGLLAAFRISSLAGIFAALSAPMAVGLIGQPALLAPTLAMALIVLWKHSDNIKRLRAGTEPRVGQSKAV